MANVIRNSNNDVRAITLLRPRAWHIPCSAYYQTLRYLWFTIALLRTIKLRRAFRPASDMQPKWNAMHFLLDLAASVSHLLRNQIKNYNQRIIFPFLFNEMEENGDLA